MKKTFDKLPISTGLKDIKLSKKNKELINQFLKHLDGAVTEVRLKKYRYALLRFADLVEKDFDKLTKEDMFEAGKIIKNGNLAVKTQQDVISEVRTAFKFWFGDDEFFPKILVNFKQPISKSRIRLPDDPSEMPNEKTIYNMVKACKNSRDEFYIALNGLDGALRPIEARSLLWGDCHKDKYGYYLVVRTAKKSGIKDTRVVRIIKSEPYFIKWNRDYPAEKKDNAHIFINHQNLKPMAHSTITALFRRLKKKLGLKRCYSYLLRHSLITQMSKDPTIPEAVLKKFVGHSLRSNTISEYQHFGDDDLKDMQLQYNGIKKEIKQKKEDKRKPIKCFKCNKSNEYDAEFCAFCNMALSQKRMVEIDEVLKKNNELMFKQVQKMIKEQLTISTPN